MNRDFESLGSLPGAVLAVALLLAASYGLGRLALLPLRIPRLPVDAVLIRFPIGLTLIGWITVVLGAWRWLPPAITITLLVALSLVGAAAATLDFRQYAYARNWKSQEPLRHTPPPLQRSTASSRRSSRRRPAIQSGLTNKNPRLARWLVAFASVVALITLGPALCPPTGWDELVYHHELPRRWLADGWPAVYRDLPYSGFPSLAELLFWLLAPLDNVITPRLLMWVTWIVAIAAVYRLLRRRLALNSAATFTATFALSGALLMISANCYVECLLLLNTATLLLTLEQRWTRQSDPLAPRAESRSQAPARERTGARLPPHVSLYAQAAIIGVLAGGAAAVKLTGLAIALLPCLWYAMQVFTRRLGARQAITAVTVYLLTAALVAFPFYLRPYLQTGNPFYPYYAHWFTSDQATLEMSRFHHGLGAAFGVHTPEALLTGPILLAFSADVYDGAFGWQLLMLLGLAVLAFFGLKRPPTNPKRQRGYLAHWSARPSIVYMLWPALMASGLYLFWFFTAQQARFAIPAALGLMLLAAHGLRQLRGARRTWVLAALLATTVISLPYRNAGFYLGSWMRAVGLIKPADYITVATGGVDPSDQEYVPLIKALREHLPPDAKLLVLFEHRVFYLPGQPEIGTPFFQEANFTPPEKFATPDLILARLKQRNITHVLLPNAPAGPDRLTDAWFDRLEDFLPCFGHLKNEGKLDLVWQSSRYLLLKLNSDNNP